MFGAIRDRVRIPVRKVLAGFVLSGAVLATLAYLVDWRRLVAHLGRADPVVYAAAPAAVVLALVAWTEGQRRLLVASGVELTHVQTLLSVCAGTFLRLVVPMGNVGGPAMVAYAVGKQTDRSYEEDLAAVSVGEMISLVASLVVGGVGALAVFGTAAPARIVRVLEAGLAVLALAVLTLAAALVRRPGAAERAVLALAGAGRATVGRLSARVDAALDPEAVRARLSGFFEAFDAVAADGTTVAVAACFYLAGWALFTVPMVASFRALGHPVDPAFALFLVPAGGVANFFPLPGGLGGAETILTGIVHQLLGLSLPRAAAVVFLYQLSAYWFMLLVAAAGSAALSAKLGASAR